MRLSTPRRLSIETAAKISADVKSDGGTVGLCHGCFDLLHSGHAYHLACASSQVDLLFVSITPGEHVHKGTGRPVFTDEARLAMLCALRFVDFAILSDGPTAVSVIRRLQPNLYFKGPDYDRSQDPRLAGEAAAVLECGGKLVLTDGAHVDSSSRAIEASSILDRHENKTI